MYRTTDGFASKENFIKTKLPNDPSFSSINGSFVGFQGYYNLTIEVEPTDDAIIYVGGIDLHKSVNRGDSWVPISKYYTPNLPVSRVHPDHHAMSFRPGNTNEAVFGTDGGVYYANNLASADNDTTAIQSRVNEYVTTQFVKAAIGPNGVANQSEIFMGNT